jgi:F-type H+-transporting ATPase subunit b
MTAEAAVRLDALKAEALKNAEEEAAAIIERAREQARGILSEAREQTDAERARLEKYFKTEVTSLAVDIAAKLLEREVREKDNARLVDEALSQWKS